MFALLPFTLTVKRTACLTKVARQPLTLDGIHNQVLVKFVFMTLKRIKNTERILHLRLRARKRFKINYCPCMKPCMHAWFVGRQEDYQVQEPFCKMVSFVISEQPGGPEYCSWFSSLINAGSDMLMKYLCEMGMNVQKVSQTLK